MELLKEKYSLTTVKVDLANHEDFAGLDKEREEIGIVLGCLCMVEVTSQNGQDVNELILEEGVVEGNRVAGDACFATGKRVFEEAELKLVDNKSKYEELQQQLIDLGNKKDDNVDEIQQLKTQLKVLKDEYPNLMVAYLAKSVDYNWNKMKKHDDLGQHVSKDVMDFGEFYPEVEEYHNINLNLNQKKFTIKMHSNHKINRVATTANRDDITKFIKEVLSSGVKYSILEVHKFILGLAQTEENGKTVYLVDADSSYLVDTMDNVTFSSCGLNMYVCKTNILDFIVEYLLFILDDHKVKLLQNLKVLQDKNEVDDELEGSLKVFQGTESERKIVLKFDGVKFSEHQERTGIPEDHVTCRLVEKELNEKYERIIMEYLDVQKENDRLTNVNKVLIDQTRRLENAANEAEAHLESMFGDVEMTFENASESGNDNNSENTNDLVGDDNTKQTDIDDGTLEDPNDDKKSDAGSGAEEEGGEEFIVERILDKRIVSGTTEYLLQWKGCTSDENTWEPECNLTCPELLKDFNKKWRKEQQQNKKAQTKKRVADEPLKSKGEDKKEKSKKAKTVTPKNVEDPPLGL